MLNAMALAGTVVSATAKSFPVLLFGQALGGLSRSGLVVGSTLTLALVIKDPKLKALIIGLVSSCYGIMIKLAPIIAGALLEIKSREAWRTCFIIAMPFEVVALVGTYAWPRLRRKRSRLSDLRGLDFVGGALSVAWVACWTLPLVNGQGQSLAAWRSPAQVAAYILALPLIALWLWWEWRKPEEDRFLPMRYMARDRSLLCYGVLTAMSSVLLACTSMYLPLYFQVVRGDSPLIASLYQLPCVVVGSVVSAIVSFNLFRWGPRTPQYWSLAGLGVALPGAIAFWWVKADANVGYILGTVFAGAIASGATFALGMTLVTELVPINRFGSAVAYMAMASVLGGTIGVALQGVFMTRGHEVYLEMAAGAIRGLSDRLGEVGLYLSKEETQALAAEARHGLTTGYGALKDVDPTYKLIQHDAQKFGFMMQAGAIVIAIVAALLLKPHISYADARARAELDPLSAEMRKRRPGPSILSSSPFPSSARRRSALPEGPRAARDPAAGRGRPVSTSFDAKLCKNDKPVRRSVQSDRTADTRRLNLVPGAPLTIAIPDSRPGSTLTGAQLSLNHTPRVSLQQDHGDLALPPVVMARSPLQKAFDSIRRRTELSRTLRERRMRARVAQLPPPIVAHVGREQHWPASLAPRASPSLLTRPPIAKVIETRAAQGRVRSPAAVAVARAPIAKLESEESDRSRPRPSSTQQTTLPPVLQQHQQQQQQQWPSEQNLQLTRPESHQSAAPSSYATADAFDLDVQSDVSTPTVVQRAPPVVVASTQDHRHHERGKTLASA